MTDLKGFRTIPQTAREVVHCAELTVRTYVKRGLISTVPVGSFDMLPPDQQQRAAEIYAQNRRRAG